MDHQLLRFSCLLGYALLSTVPFALADSTAGSVPLGSHYNHYDSLAGADSVGEPGGEITLEKAVTAALVRNPTLAAWSWAARAREAGVVQAGLLPNPTLDVELENVAGSGQRQGVDQAETTIQLSQLVPIGGKLAMRRGVADSRGELARWDYEVARIDVLTSTTKAFVALLGAQQRLDLLVELEKLARDGVDSSASRVRAGAAPVVARTRAEVVLLSVQLDRAQAERDLESRRVALSATWGSSAPTFSGALGDLSSGLVEPPPLAQLSARAASNPDLARWGAELEAREASLSLAKALRLPDPTFRLAGRHFNANDDGALVFGVSLPLPLFNRNQGNALAAAHEVERAHAQQMASALAVRSSLARTYQELSAAFNLARSLREETLPVARRAFEGTREGYRRGTFRYLDVLDAQRTLFNLRSREVDALSRYHQARADIERLLGEAIDQGDPNS